MSLRRWVVDGLTARRSLDAHGAVRLAEDQLSISGRSEGAHLCCVYMSTEEGSVPSERISSDGAWHIYYYVPKDKALFLVRIQNGKAKGWLRPLQGKPVEYLFAAYGGSDSPSEWPSPVALPSESLDFPSLAKAALKAARREATDRPQDSRRGDDYRLICLVLPASYLRYLYPRSSAMGLLHPPPSTLCCAAIVSHVDTDSMDSTIVYVDAQTGDVADCGVFRFPLFACPSCSIDW